MTQPFNEERIEHLTTNYNWELAFSDSGDFLKYKVMGWHKDNDA